MESKNQKTDELMKKIEKLGLPEFSTNTTQVLEIKDFWYNLSYEVARNVFIAELAQFYYNFELENSIRLTIYSYEFICRSLLEKYNTLSSGVDYVCQKENNMIIQGLMQGRTRLTNSWVRHQLILYTNFYILLHLKQIISHKFSKKMRNLRAKNKENRNIRTKPFDASKNDEDNYYNEKSSSDSNALVEESTNPSLSQKRLLSSNTLSTVTSNSKNSKIVITTSVKSNLTPEQIHKLHKKLVEVTSKSRYNVADAKTLLIRTHDYRRDYISMSNQTFHYFLSEFPYLQKPELVSFYEFLVS